MKRYPASPNWPALAIVLSLLFFAGCSKKDSADNGSQSTAGAGSGSASSDGAGSAGSIAGEGDKDAVTAVRDELSKRWLKTPDGWVSEFPAKTYIATGERAGPESFYRQIKELKFNVQPNEISESDKLNGIQYRGYCQFTYSPARSYGDPNAFGPPQWSEWKESNETVSAVRKNGKWAFNSLGFMVSGTKPSAGIVSRLK